MLRHGGGWPPLTSAAVPVTLPSRVMVSSARQAEERLLAGELWQDHGLVFASAIGTPLDRHNVRREFRKITKAAGLGTDWVPREMRHTFVSLLSSNGMALEDIADLVGHRGTAMTETVYRKVIVPELRRGAEVIDRLFT